MISTLYHEYWHGNRNNKGNNLKSIKGVAMKAINLKRCAICGKAEAVDTCDACGKAICKKCLKLEIWGTGAEDLSFKHLCPSCKDNPEINPWGAIPEEFGLGEVLEIINVADKKQLPLAA
jgi:hypothetical protein